MDAFWGLICALKADLTQGHSLRRTKLALLSEIGDTGHSSIAWDLSVFQRRQTDSLHMVFLADKFESVQDFFKGLQYNSQVIFVPMVSAHRAGIESSFL